MTKITYCRALKNYLNEPIKIRIQPWWPRLLRGCQDSDSGSVIRSNIPNSG